MLRRFEVHRAASIDEAIALRQRYGADGALYAGGTELLATMKMGLARWPHLIDIKHIAELGRVEATPTVIRIGAAVTHRSLERDATVARVVPALARLERDVANIRVRAVGTIGGNLAFAEPHADPPALLLALGARVVLQGPGGTRTVGIAELITGMYQTTIADDEIMVAIEIPVPPAGTRAAYVKFQILERPSVGVAVVARVADGRFASAPSVVVGAVDEVPRAVPTDDVAGASVSDSSAAERIAEAARTAVDPVGDLAGAPDYKRHLVGVFARRALARLAEAA